MSGQITAAVSGGQLLIQAGGIDSGSVIYSGLETISSGGKAVGTDITGGSQTILSGGMAHKTTISSGGPQFVSGGTAISAMISSGGIQTVFTGSSISGAVYYGGTEKVVSGGTEIVAAGGIETGGRIAGGTLEIASGGTAAASIAFSGSGGRLIIDGPVLPATTISGFIAGDSVQLAGVVYASGATVTVLTANTVTISNGASTYNLTIAGASVGESDFNFGPGEVLTKTAATQMKFIVPAPTDHAPMAAARLRAETWGMVAPHQAPRGAALAVVSPLQPAASRLGFNIAALLQGSHMPPMIHPW